MSDEPTAPEDKRTATIVVVDDDTPPPLPTSIDPRFRARRIAVKRQAGRKRLRWVAVLIALLALVAAAVVVVRSPLLAVRTVDVTGAVYTDPGQVAAIADDVHGQAIVTLDMDALAHRFEALPWVMRADVRRAWPRTIKIDLLERRPVATFYAPDGNYRVIDREGRVLASLNGQPIDVISINGDGPVVAPGQTAPSSYVGAAEVASALPNELRARVLDMALDAHGEISLRMNGGGQVLLGPPTDVRSKLVSVLGVLANTDPASAMGTLDVRVPEKPVMRPA
jgi:cell division septal protein FtsQ